MALSVEELMKPRIVLVAPIPFCIHEVGHTFSMKVNGLNEMYFTVLYDDGNNRDIWLEDAERYPHLFKSLKWYEDREPEEMPEYVKIVVSHMKHYGTEANQIFKVHSFDLREGWNSIYLYGLNEPLTGNPKSFPLSYVDPSTFEEYQSQKQTSLP